MKKFIAVITALVIIFSLASCASAGPSAAPSGTAASAGAAASGAQPSKSVEPSKTPLEQVFGKEVKIAAVSSGDDAASALFFAGVKLEAAALGIEASTVAAGDSFDTKLADAAKDADVIVAYLPEAPSSYSALEKLAKDGKAVSIYELKKGGEVSGISRTYYNSEKELDTILNDILTYPPHDEPVRLFGLFESKDSDAYKAYQAMVQDGKIYPRETYVKADASETTADAWLGQKLPKYIEGMLDAIYAENQDLAKTALDALAAKSRSDTEVFTTGVTQEAIERMKLIPEVFAQIVGSNDVYAGVLNVQIALDMLKGAKAAEEELTPATISAADFKDDPIAAMAAYAPEDLSKKYVQAWMDQLKTK